MKIGINKITKWVIGIVGIVVLSSAGLNNSDKYFEIAKNLEIFTNIYKELNTHYVDDLEPNQLMRTGIDAMMNSLDPYTVYYSESQVESYRLSTDDKYSGLGAASQIIDDKFTISEIYNEGPAQEAGLQVGDQVVSINGQSTEGRSYKDILQFVRGFPGTTLELTVNRPVENKNHNISLKRSQVDIPNVPYSGMVSDHVGYINLTTFTQNASKNIAKAWRKLKNENELEGLILDLRSNGGGLLSEAVDILGLVLPQGTPVVSTRGKVRDRDQNYSTRRLPIDLDLPIVVLVNKTSASASEIVSGSIQDMDRGVIMGQRTYGKGLVQNHKEVGYNSRIKVTISKYYIPSGRCIQSVAYANGAPKDIEDKDRAVFYTRNKRPVLDGGGVTPDIKLTIEERADIIKTLTSENWIFKYANAYVANNPEVQDFESFAFSDYDAFLSFLDQGNFEYSTEEEKALMTLEKSLNESNSGDIGTELKSIKDKLSALKVNDLVSYKDEIKDGIEAELAKRYFLQEGKTRQMLKNDSEIKEAIALLNDSARYNAILN